ncbi:MAG: GerMN domain-containing protein [Actinomycetota bacterium]|nr:GerMN domain-containing protein [Actinomycetota bacterium]
MNVHQRLWVPAGILLALLLAGCSGPTAPSPSGPSATATGTSTAPSADGGSGSASSGPATPPSPAAAVTAPVTLYYVAFADNGAAGPMIGCGDSIVATTSAPLTYTNKLQAAMNALLANRSAEVGQSGLSNTLWQSSLALVDASIAGGVATVNLSGNFVQGGECDSPRIIAQLRQTASAASGAATVNININGVPLEKALSLK